MLKTDNEELEKKKSTEFNSSPFFGKLVLKYFKKVNRDREN